MRKRRLFVQAMAAVLSVQLLVPAMPVYADPYVAGFSDEELTDADEINDEEAVEQATSGKFSSELADPEEAAAYLLENAQSGVLKQVPTDETDESLPKKFDLREKGVVTPVKFQNPWGTCWGFSAIAACETSILSKTGKTYEETGLDLSEHHLTYFSRTHLNDGSSQSGEGVYMVNDSDTFNTGGNMFTAASIFSTGIGPVDEAAVPYRGKNSKTDHILFMNYDYSEDDDWTLPEDSEFTQSYDLTGTNLLPSPAVYDTPDDGEETDQEEGEQEYLGYDAWATDAIKRELMAGKAVSVAFSADQFRPGAEDFIKAPLYLNTEDNKWTHYTFEDAPANHAVTIVGWDDDILSSSFLDHTNDEYGDGKAHQPEGNGAWIVKNSWGAQTEEFPNCNSWGLVDDEGNSTGYFYISYYDRSLSIPESFDFNVEERSDSAYMIDQYDYMQSDSTEGWADENGLQMANVFTAESDGTIDAVSCQTNSENISVTYQIYFLDDGVKQPDDGKLVCTASEDYEFAGYHKKMLDEPVSISRGQRYSVIVTSCFEAGNQLYYELSTTTGLNKAYVEEYNRKILYKNRNVIDPSLYEEELIKYYSKGIVNEGESFVYMDELGKWGDFADIVPYLQKDEQFEDSDFDNFPIKAYLSFADKDEANAVSENITPTDISFAEPAGSIYMPFIFKCVAAAMIIITVIVILITFIVILIRKKKAAKKHLNELEEKVPQLEAARAQMEDEIRKLKEELTRHNGQQQ